MRLLAVLLCAVRLSGTRGTQVPIPRVSSLPNVPANFRVVDWRGYAVGQQRYFFGEQAADAERLGVICEGRSQYRTCPGAWVWAMPGNAGLNRMPCTQESPTCPEGGTGPPAMGESLTQLGALLGTALLRLDRGAPMRRNRTANYATAGLCYVSRLGLVRDNPGYLDSPGVARSIWYWLAPNIFFSHLVNYTYNGARLAPAAVERSMQTAMLSAAEWWPKIVRAYPNGDFNFTGFNLSSMRPISPTQWREQDGAAGYAYLIVVTAVFKHGSLAAADEAEPGMIEAARVCLQYLHDLYPINGLYETLLPYGALAAARLNSELGHNWNVTMLLSQSLGDGLDSEYRRGWGMISDTWGSDSVSGIIGSTLDGGGYAFSGNTYWWLLALAPVPRYIPQFSRAIAKWILHLASSSRFFLNAELTRQLSNSTTGLKYDPHRVMAYESCRKCDFDRNTGKCLHGNSYGPFGQTDANGGPQGLGEYCSQGMYGGNFIAALGAVVRRTNVSNVLQLDIGAVDFHPSAGSEHGPTFLLWNPNQASVVVALDPSTHNSCVDIVEAHSSVTRASCCGAACALRLAADEAVVVRARSKLASSANA